MKVYSDNEVQHSLAANPLIRYSLSLAANPLIRYSPAPDTQHPTIHGSPNSRLEDAQQPEP